MRYNRFLLALTLVVASLFAAQPAHAGSGTGYIVHESWSVQCTKGSLDYLGRSGYYSSCPGTRIGGAGSDMDALWIPPNRNTRVLHQITGTYTWYNTRGKAGYWVKISDYGVRVLVQY